MAQITWNDGTAKTLHNGKPGPAGRFSGWVTYPVTIGEAVVGLGSGIRYTEIYRVSWRVRFVLPHIPRGQYASGSPSVYGQQRMAELQAHLQAGGTCSVQTQDSGNRNYTCNLPEDVELEPPVYDPEMREYSLVLTLQQRVSDPAPLICIYP